MTAPDGPPDDHGRAAEGPRPARRDRRYPAAGGAGPVVLLIGVLVGFAVGAVGLALLYAGVVDSGIPRGLKPWAVAALAAAIVAVAVAIARGQHAVGGGDVAAFAVGVACAAVVVGGCIVSVAT